MKLLVAIESSDIKLINKSVRWAGRAGYDLRIFVKGIDWEPYVDRLKEINMIHYLHLTHKHLVVDSKPMQYAADNGYDLILIIPEKRPAFSGKRKMIDLDAEVPLFAEAVGRARVELGTNPDVDSVTLKRGVTMRRVIHHGKEARQT